MKQQKTVESRVLEILKECPMSRYDDMLLILHYYNRYGYIPAGNLPLEDIVFNYRAYGLPLRFQALGSPPFSVVS